MSDNSLPFVSIVIPAFNEELYVASCLTSLRSLTYPKSQYEILLIDNGSTDQTIEVAREFTEVDIYVKKNAKVGAVRNYGMQKAKGSVIVFLDADCEVSRNWLTEGVEWLTAHPNSVVGGSYLLRENPSWIERYWVLGSPERSVTAALLGGCIFIPKNIFQTVGGFDEKLNAGEDNDLTVRLRNKQYHVEIEPSLSVVHLGYPSRIWPFISRQLWHSSDYISGLPKTLCDKTFLLTLAFMVGLLGSFGSMVFLPEAYPALIISVVIVLISPVFLSMKRIMRMTTKQKKPLDFISIYLVDCLYLVGRTLGVLSGIKKSLSVSSKAKVVRR